MRLGIGIAILALQALAILYARTGASRYFCWAPFDMQTDYSLRVSINGTALTPAQIRERYKRPAVGTDNRSVQHVIDIIEQTERRYHPQDHCEIRMAYRINGKEEERWSFRR